MYGDVEGGEGENDFRVRGGAGAGGRGESGGSDGRVDGHQPIRKGTPQRDAPSAPSPSSPGTIKLASPPAPKVSSAPKVAAVLLETQMSVQEMDVLLPQLRTK